MAVKIKELFAPSGDLSEFDPGTYLAQLEFYETGESISERDREGLAEMLHYLAYLALKSKSPKWAGSFVPRDTTAFDAIHSHFCNLQGWSEIQSPEGISYKSLVSFLMPHYQPGITKNA